MPRKGVQKTPNKGLNLWSFQGREWLREIHDCKARRIVTPKGAQIGVSETMINRTFYGVDIEGCDVLYVLPTGGDVLDFSSGRLSGAISLSPRLENLFTEVNNVKHKKAGHCNLYIRGSNSKSGMKSIPVQRLFLDEFDEIVPSQVAAARERLGAANDPFEMNASTPTFPESGIWVEWGSSRQHFFFIKCPKCDHDQHLTWPENILYEGDSKSVKAWVCCSKCKFKIPHEKKGELVKRGVWRCVANSHADHYGFHINQLYSSTIAAHPNEIVRASFKTDEESKTIFCNSKLGLPYIPEGTEVTPDMIKYCQTSTPMYKKAPSSCMGVDVSATGLHYVELVEGTRSGHKVVLNSFNANWNDLYRIMEVYGVRCCVIDAQPERSKAREFAESFPGQIYMAFYPEGLKVPYVVHEDKQVVSIDRSEGLETMQERFKNGTVSIPKFPDIDEYAKQISSPMKTYKLSKTGLPIVRYISRGPDHFAHAATYADVALQISPVSSWDPIFRVPSTSQLNEPGQLYF